MTQRTRKRSWNLLIKIGFTAAFLVVVGWEMTNKRDLPALWTSFKAEWTMADAWMVFLAFALMPVNWLLETQKWRLLLRASYRIKMRDAVKAIAGGIALSLFTPNRIGEYGGRILFVPPEYNWRAVLATLAGSFSQNLVHLSAGIVAAWWLLSRPVALPAAISDKSGFLASLILVVLTIAYFNLGRIGRFLQRMRGPGWLGKFCRACVHLEKISKQELSAALGMSLVRYIVFSTQFILLLMYFDVGVPLPWLMAGVAMMYLMQTSIPLPPFVDLVARSELAILIWAGFAVNELTVLAASFFIWIINLLLPAFFGLLSIGSVNVLQSLGYEQAKELHHDTDHADDPADGRSAVRPGDESVHGI